MAVANVISRFSHGNFDTKIAVNTRGRFIKVLLVSRRLQTFATIINYGVTGNRSNVHRTR